VDKDFVEKCHEAGIMVNVWTVNEEEDILRMSDIGVDIIMTDNIPLAKKLLRNE
jgi:glycerophosphoryl diester phosphodiesterase